MFNRVIKILIVSDFFLLSGLGLIAPIFAVFIINNIQGADVSVVGIAVGIYWILKSIIQVPIGKYLDKKHGEKDDFYFLIIGTFLASLVPLGFIFASLPWHLYALQIIQAVAMAMAVPSWGGIFIRHIDKGKEAMTWSFESAAVGIGAGSAGIIGGIIAKTFGFVPLFIGVSILGIFAACLFMLISKNLILKTERGRLILPKTIDRL
jgi:MFS family permease